MLPFVVIEVWEFRDRQITGGNVMSTDLMIACVPLLVIVPMIFFWIVGSKL